MHKKILLLFSVLITLIIPQIALGALSFNKPFSYYAEQQDINTVLMHFAKSQNYTAIISPQIEGKISGRFTAINPNDFLNSMHSAFQVNYYHIDNTLYFYHTNEFTQSYLSPQAMTAGQMFALLKDAHVFSPDLMPSMAKNSSIILIQGPQSYIDKILQAANSFEQIQMQQTVMKVFPLKYAWADDITISSMDKDITIPGVATILRAMLTGETVSASRQTQRKATVESLNGAGLNAVGKEEEQGTNTANTTQNSNTSNIMADPRVNAVIINDASYRMPYYADVIADLDKPVELVEIHAAIVDINTNYSRELGVTYQGKNQNNEGWSVGGELGDSTDAFNALPVAGELGARGLSLSTIYTMGSDFFLAKIQALQEDGEARMLGKPSVLTVDNVQASLENTSTYYLEVEGYETVDLFKVEAGTVLRVTPHIIKNNDGSSSIKLAVSVQDNQNDSNDSPLKANGISPVKQTKINTQAIVGSNQSLLIGGYYYEEKTDNESGIPVLKNIPILGHLFKNSSKGTRRMERLILITPKIIRLDDLPQSPEYIDTKEFSKSPTQSDYERRPQPEPNGSGCTKKSTPVQS